MAYDLKKLEKPNGNRSVIVTLFGEGGMGKTTLASMFPRPVFIRTEDGTASIGWNDEVDVFPVAETTADVFAAIEALKTQEHDRKTLVVDSVTQFEKLATKEIIDSEPNPKAKNLAAAHGGYGRGFGMLDAKHQELREAIADLPTKHGMNVVFLMHATIEDMDLPDIDKYNRYTVALQKSKQFDCSHHYTNNVDLVGLIRLKTNTAGGSDGKKVKAISTGEREIICFPQAVSTTKNRFHITDPIPFSANGENPLQMILPKGE